METKTCTKCKQVKPLEDFHVQKRSPDGRRYRCKACTCEDQSARHQLNKERYAEMRKRRAAVAAFKKKYEKTPEQRELERRQRAVQGIQWKQSI